MLFEQINEVSEEETITFALEVENCLSDTNVNITSTFVNNTLDYVNGSASDGGSFTSEVVMYPQIDNLAAYSSLSYAYQATVKAGAYYDPVSMLQDDMDVTTNWIESGIGANAWAIANNTSCGSSSYYINNFETESERIITLSPITPNGVISLSFDHYFNTEKNYDGGLVEISNDAGASWTDLGPYFNTNGYNDYINNNIREPAFSGNSGGCITSTTVPLTAFPGTLQVRFRFLTDVAISGDGWYIDTVSITDHAAAVIENMSQGDNKTVSSKHAVLISQVLSVPDNEHVELSIYPNPTNGLVSIEGIEDLQTVKVFNISGQEVIYQETSELQLDMTALQSGVYFLELTTQNGSITKKLIKQ